MLHIVLDASVSSLGCIYCCNTFTMNASFFTELFTLVILIYMKFFYVLLFVLIKYLLANLLLECMNCLPLGIEERELLVHILKEFSTCNLCFESFLVD